MGSIHFRGVIKATGWAVWASSSWLDSVAITAAIAAKVIATAIATSRERYLSRLIAIANRIFMTLVRTMET